MIDKTITQVQAGKWYAVAHGPEPLLEECCDCGLVHRATFRVRNGRIWVKWDLDVAATRKARRRPQAFVRKGNR